MIEEYLEYLLHIKKYSKHTIDSYQQDLYQYQEFLKEHNCAILNIDKRIAIEYKNHIGNIYTSKSTMSNKITAVRSFYNYLVREEIIENNPFNTIKNPKLDKKLPQFLKSDQLNKMFQVSDLTTPLGQRNRLILEILYATGIRVHELVTIKLQDIETTKHIIKILGKGNKERIVFYGEECQKILDLYLNKGRKQLLKKETPYLLLNHYGNPITERSIRNILNDIIIKSSVNMHISPHTLRHTFATDMLNNGADLISVKELLGHSSLNTTSIYTHVTNEQIKKVYNFAHPRANQEREK